MCVWIKYFARDVAPSEKTKEVLMVTLAVFQQNVVDKKMGNFLVLAQTPDRLDSWNDSNSYWIDSIGLNWLIFYLKS